MHPRTFTGGLLAGLILCFAVPFASCHKTTVQPAGTGTPLDLPAGSATVTGAANQFAVNVFQQVLQTEPSGTNVLISPLSIFLALDMTYNGAAGSTADSMASTLQLSGVPLGQLNAVSHALLQQLPKEDGKVQLDIANSIWYNVKGPTPGTAFLDTISNSYQGAAQGLDFSNPTATGTINSWVAKNTGNKIPKIIQSINAGEVMFLINAIYFNGSWHYGFNPDSTHTGDFHLANGNTVAVPFMNETATLGFYSDSTLSVLELPYGTGQAFDMYLVAPQGNTPINTFAAGLNATILDKALLHLDTGRLAVTLPKWEYSYDIPNMQPELTAMGMGIAFGNGADFSVMYPGGGTAISRVIHKTYIQVSENGTQAAAVTAVGAVTTAYPAKPPHITFDHPFAYLIRERQTGMILFIGVVNDPSQQ